MTLHPILSKKYIMWWFIMAIVISLKIILLGFKPNGLSVMEGYENRGLVFWNMGVIFCGIVYASPIYLLYRVF